MAIPTGTPNTGGPSSGVGAIPMTNSNQAMTGGGGNIATTGGTNTVGGSYWYDSAAQYAMYLGNIELQKLLEEGVNRRFAQEIADRERDRSLQRSIATGYIDGNPTIDRQVAEWNRQNQLWNQGYSEQQLALDKQATEWDRQHQLWGEGNQEQQLGLQYLQTLASMRGPRDWLTYANTVRNAENTQLPAYMQALANGSTLSGFQSTLGTTNGTNSFQGGTLAPQYTVDPNQSYSGVGTGNYVPPWARSYGQAGQANIGQTSGQPGYQAPWQQNYGGFTSVGMQGGGSGSSTGNTMDYAAAIAQARSQLSALDGRWGSASDAQIIAELRNNQSLFVNSPIRNALFGGGQQGGGDMRASGMTGGQMSAMGGMANASGFTPYAQNGQQMYSGGTQGFNEQTGQYNNGYAPTPKWMQPGQTVGQYPGSGAPTQQRGAMGSGNPYTNPGAYSQFNISANQVRPDQWNNMTNSEQQMLFGQIENAGGDATDWEQTMRRSWLGGNARGSSRYGF